MASKKLSLSSDRLNEIMASGKVRSALAAKASRVLPRAKAVAFSVGASEFAGALHIIEGRRPGTASPTGLKRPYARIMAEVTPEMKKADGRTKLTRRQILRRGAGG